MTEAR